MENNKLKKSLCWFFGILAFFTMFIGGLAIKVSERGETIEVQQIGTLIGGCLVALGIATILAISISGLMEEEKHEEK